jgi:uncharacterized protein YhfF
MAAGLRHDDYDVVAFGSGAEMATELAELAVAGIKRATAGLVRQFGPDGEPPPVVGGYVVLLDGANRPRGCLAPAPRPRVFRCMTRSKRYSSGSRSYGLPK